MTKNCITHEGECIISTPSLASCCQMCGVRARVEVDGTILCYECARWWCNPHQWDAVKKYYNNPTKAVAR